MRDSQAGANLCNALFITRNEHIMLSPYSERTLNCLLDDHRASLGTELLEARLN
jgi:hypothetical protein